MSQNYNIEKICLKQKKTQNMHLYVKYNFKTSFVEA